MKKMLIPILAFTFFSTIVFGQTSLSLGDIAFTGYQSDNPDLISFVLLTDITTGTSITFTDDGWYAAGGFRTSENGSLTWTASSNIPYGTQIEINDLQGIVSGSVALSTSGDQLFAYQGTAPTAGDESNFIAAIQMNGSWDADATSSNTSAIPSVFTDGINSIAITPEQDNGAYDCIIMSSDANTLRSAVNNFTNWVTSSSTGVVAIPPCSGQPLPVELSSFTTELTSTGVLCKWTTESETENLGFLLERKTTDTDWQEIVSYKQDESLLGQGSVSFATDYKYLDNLVQQGLTYEYRLADIDYNSVVTYHATREVIVNSNPLATVADNFHVMAYPNPFNPSTIIRYSVTSSAITHIAIYDITGKTITTLVNKEQPAGWHEIQWDGVDKSGKIVPGGIYLSRVTVGNEVKTSKLILLR